MRLLDLRARRTTSSQLSNMDILTVRWAMAAQVAPGQVLLGPSPGPDWWSPAEAPIVTDSPGRILLSRIGMPLSGNDFVDGSTMSNTSLATKVCV